MASPTSSPRQAQQITEEANLQIQKKKKKKKKTPIQSKSLNQKPQISTSEITKAKANLKIEQRLPLEVRSVQLQSRLQSTSSLIGDRLHIVGDRSSPKHIIVGSHVVVARPSLQIADRSMPQLLWCLMLPPSRYFSLFFSLTLSQSLIEMKVKTMKI